MKLAQELNQNLNKLLKIQETVISQLPQDYQQALSFAKKDMKTIEKAVKTGDLGMLNELTKRYANTSNTE